MRTIVGSFCVLALAACPLQGSKNLTLGGGGGGGGTSTPSPAKQGQPATSSAASDADREREAQAEWHGKQGQSNLDAANFLRAEFEALGGLTVAKAKAKAKERGHDGEVQVREESAFVEGCKDGIVCRATDQGGGQSGMSNGDVLVLHINKKLSIAPPPD